MMRVGIFGYTREAWERITAHRDYGRIALQGRARNDAEFAPIIFIEQLHGLALMENDLRDNPPYLRAFGSTGADIGAVKG